LEPGVDEINQQLKAGLKVTVTEKPGCRRVLKIEVPAPEVNREFEAAYKRLRQNLSVPGYRKGKVPLQLLKARYRDSAVQEVKENLVPKAYEQALKEKNLSPISMQELSEIELAPDRPLEFKVEIEVPPQIEELNYKELEVEKPVFLITEKLIDKTLEELQQSHGEETVVDRKAQRGDILTVDLEKVTPEGLSPERRENLEITLKPGAVQEEFYQTLVGKGSGELVEVTVAGSDDRPQEGSSAERVEYRLKIKEVKEIKLPELNEEFAKRFTGWIGRPDPQNIAELKANIEADLDIKARKEAGQILRRNLIRKVVEANPIEIPESFVSDYTKSVSRGLKAKLTDLEEEKFQESYRPHAIDELRWELLFHRIAEQEKIEVTADDLGTWARKYAERFQLPEEKIRQNLSDEKEKERIEEQILEDKIIDFLLSKSGIKEKGLPYDAE
jgi:trigger factor